MPGSVVRSCASFAISPGGIRSAARRPDVGPQRLLEAVAAPAVVASVEMELRLRDLDVGELAVEIALEELLALVAVVHYETASSASLALRSLRPR